MLNLLVLKNKILNDIFLKEVPLPSMANFAEQLATAYKEYCEDAMTYADDPLATFGKSMMKSVLLLLDAPGNTPAYVGLVIESSIIAFWNSSSFVVGTPPSGFSSEFTIDITPMSPGMIQSGIASGILSGGDAEIQATLWATAMHNATLTVKTSHYGFDLTLPTPLPKEELDKNIL